MLLSVRNSKIVLFCVIVVMLTSTAFGAEIHVPESYATIQEAVDAAVEGDTIIVGDGTYIENIMVNKTLVIRSENGTSQTFVQAQDTGRHIFWVLADQVTIEGFTITGASDGGAAGICVSSGYRQSIIRDNQVGMESGGNVYGILLSDSHANLLEGNEISNNSQYGVILSGGSGGNTVRQNLFFSSGLYGIVTLGSSGNTFIENELRQSTSYGMFLSNGSSDNLVSGNLFIDGNAKLRIAYYSNNNRVVGNTYENGTSAGIQIDHDSINNTISQNEFKNNSSGTALSLWDTGVNEVFENTVDGNSYGMILQNATDSRVYGNSFSNSSHSGILLHFSSQGNMLYNNLCTGNGEDGIRISDSHFNEVYSNTFSGNGEAGLFLNLSQGNVFYQNNVTGNAYGISVESSNDNQVYLNSFEDNTENVLSSDSQMSWQSGQEISYLYQGTAYSGFLGNFYSDHVLTDSNGDGVTDLVKDQPGIDDDSYPLAMSHVFFNTTSSDMDFDEDIDGLDIAIFVEALASGEDIADLNQDQVLDSLDIEMFAASFGSET